MFRCYKSMNESIILICIIKTVLRVVYCIDKINKNKSKLTYHPNVRPVAPHPHVHLNVYLHLDFQRPHLDLSVLQYHSVMKSDAETYS